MNKIGDQVKDIITTIDYANTILSVVALVTYGMIICIVPDKFLASRW